MSEKINHYTPKAARLPLGETSLGELVERKLRRAGGGRGSLGGMSSARSLATGRSTGIRRFASVRQVPAGAEEHLTPEWQQGHTQALLSSFHAGYQGSPLPVTEQHAGSR